MASPDNLSPTEQDIVTHYKLSDQYAGCGNFAYDINDALVKKTVIPGSQMGVAIQELNSVIKTPLSFDTTLYRAIPDCTEFLKLEIGANYQPSSFTSTCRTWRALTRHLKPGLSSLATPAAVLTLRVPKGHTVLNVTPVGVDEDEVLLKPGISWKLISRSNGKREFYSPLPQRWMSNFWEICFEIQ